MGNRKNNFFMPLFFFFYNGADCITYTFIVTYLSAHGYESGFIGLVMTMCAIVNMVAQPLLGYISETFVPAKKLILAVCIVSVPLGFMVPAAVEMPVLAAIASVLCVFIKTAGFPIADMWSVKLRETYGAVNFGFVRSCGSFGYAFSGLLFGRIFDAVGIDYMFVFNALAVFATVMAILPISKVPLTNRSGDKKDSGISMKDAVKILVRNKRYVMFILAYTFINIGMRFIINFYPMLMELKGGSVSDVGVGVFLMASSEIPFIMSYSRYARHFKVERIMLFALSMFTVRNLAMLLAPNVLCLKLAQLTQGLCFGVYVPTAIYYIRSIAPEKIATTAVAVATGVVAAIGSVVGTFFGGILMEAAGAYVSILACVILAAVGAAIFLWSLFVPKTQYGEGDVASALAVGSENQGSC